MRKENCLSLDRSNKIKCIIGLITCIFILCFAFIGVALKFFVYIESTDPETGVGTFKLFTTLSNLFIGTLSLITTPFFLKNLKTKHYSLPSWLVTLLFIGTVAVTLTFCISISIISFTEGFIDTMFKRANIFLHTFNPILSVYLFCFVLSVHQIKFKHIILAMSPVLIYSVMYIIMVIILGETNGGWRDFYRLNYYVPWPFTFITILLLNFLIAYFIANLHNKTFFKAQNNQVKNYKETSTRNTDSLKIN